MKFKTIKAKFVVDSIFELEGKDLFEKNILAQTSPGQGGGGGKPKRNTGQGGVPNVVLPNASTNVNQPIIATRAQSPNPTTGPGPGTGNAGSGNQARLVLPNTPARPQGRNVTDADLGGNFTNQNRQIETDLKKVELDNALYSVDSQTYGTVASSANNAYGTIEGNRVLGGFNVAVERLRSNSANYVQEYNSQYQELSTITQGNLQLFQTNLQGINQRLGDAEKSNNQYVYQAKTETRSWASKQTREKHGDYEETMRARFNTRASSVIEQYYKVAEASATKEWDEFYNDPAKHWKLVNPKTNKVTLLTNREYIDAQAERFSGQLDKSGKAISALENKDETVKFFKSKYILDSVKNFINNTGIKDFHEVSGPILNEGGTVKLFLRPEKIEYPNDKNSNSYFGAKIPDENEITESINICSGKLRVKTKAGEIKEVDKKEVMYQFSTNSSGVASDKLSYIYANYYTQGADLGYNDLKFDSFSNRLSKTGSGLAKAAVKLFGEIDDSDSEEVKKQKQKYAGLSVGEKERKMDLLARGMEQLYEGNTTLGINIGGLIKMFFSGELFEFFKLQKDVKALNRTLTHDNSSLSEEKKVEGNSEKARDIILDKSVVINADKTTTVQITKEQAEELFKLYEASKSVHNNYPGFSAFMLDSFAGDKNNPLKFNNDQILAISAVVERAKATGSTVELSLKTQTDLQAKNPSETLGINVAGVFSPLKPEQVSALNSTASQIGDNKLIAQFSANAELAKTNPDLVLDPSKAGNNASNALANSFISMVRDGKITNTEISEFSDIITSAVRKSGYPVKDLDGNPKVDTPQEKEMSEKEARKQALAKLGFDEQTISGIIQDPKTSTDTMVKVLAAKYGFDDKDRDLLLKTLQGVSGGATVTSVDITKLPDDQKEGFSRMIKSVLHH